MWSSERYLAFIDEAGYAKGDWKGEKSKKDQPIFVHSGIIVDCNKLSTLYERIKKRLLSLLKSAGITKVAKEGVNSYVDRLGFGIEIKAADVDRNELHKSLKPLREDLMSTFLNNYGLFTAVVVAVHKEKHEESYDVAFNVYKWAFNLLVERIHFFAQRRGAEVSLVIDETPEETTYKEVLDHLKVIGSLIHSIKTDSVTDVFFGRSAYSLGLQIADFYARYTYSALKNENPMYPGWSLIKSTLDSYEGMIKGYGLKCEPAEFGKLCEKMLK